MASAFQQSYPTGSLSDNAKQEETGSEASLGTSSVGDAGKHAAFADFVATIAALRAPGGCPWDRAQTHQSIAHNMIEEAYEAVDAIEAHDVAHLREELGDVLLQVVLQSQIAADSGAFTIDDVCADVNAKMIRRHPHVFGEAQAANATEVLELWDQVKLAESNAAQPTSAGGHTAEGLGTENASTAPAQREGLLDGVPASFPALMQAQKVSRKAASAGFEWDTLDDVWEKVHEEIAELHAAYAAAPKATNGKVDASAAGFEPEASRAVSGHTEGEEARARVAAAQVEQEFGDVLFSLVNVARRMGIDAEGALRTTCVKFRRRWAFMEGAAWAQGRRIEELSHEEREALWNQAKTLEHNS